ncbi:MAG: recombinase family protein [Fusobacterium sp.]|nr:recombinase family protein [Fusobacterium sp.]MCM1073875.1 recombinase family protein [Bacteroides sp.]
MLNKQVVIYARVSSREQEREGFSIPAQLNAMKNGFEIVKEYSDAETAKKAGRTNYNIMLDFLKSNPEVKTILVEKTDRLYRNFKDYVTLEDYELEVHLVKEGTVISKDSKSHDKFIHGIKVLMAKNYIDNLSEEIKKGLHEGLEEGYWPFNPPYGYKRGEKKCLYIDTTKVLFVQRAFELFATGRYSLRKLSEKLFEDGYYYLSSRPKITQCVLEGMLKNVLYTGQMKCNGIIYQGKHPAIVSFDIFNKTQQAFNKVNKSKVRKNFHFLYPGLAKCAVCGYSMCGEVQKNNVLLPLFTS